MVCEDKTFHGNNRVIAFFTEEMWDTSISVWDVSIAL